MAPEDDIVYSIVILMALWILAGTCLAADSRDKERRIEQLRRKGPKR